MKAVSLLYMLFVLNILHIDGQESCLFYVYETKIVFSDIFGANSFEKENLENGWRNIYTRVNDTTFLDNYQSILKTSGQQRKWFFIADMYAEPTSCNLFRQDTIYDGFLSYNDVPESRLVGSKKHAFVNKNDSICITIENGKSYLRYSTKADTLHNIRGKLELNTSIEWFKSVFLRAETLTFFGDSIETLVFKEIYRNREEVIWYHKQKMVPLKTLTIFPGNIVYFETKLISIYQF